MSEVQKEAADKMQKSVEAFKNELAKVRTGRASISLLDGISVDAYGSMLPMNQVATLTIPESRMIAIQPWDPQMVPAIEKAIMASNLGLAPANDGKVIRLTIPQLTEERRKELVKQVRKTAEEFRVAVRNVRRDSIRDLREFESEKMISEDDQKRGEEELQKITDRYVEQIGEVAERKEAEIMEV